MENKPSTEVGQSFDAVSARQEDSAASTSLQGSSELEQSIPRAPAAAPTTNSPEPEYFVMENKRKLGARLRLIIVFVGLALVLGLGAFVFIQRDSRNSQVQAGDFGVVRLPLGDISTAGSLTEKDQTLKISGRLEVTNSLVLNPIQQPGSPVIGQIYYDQATNRIAYYDGQQFMNLASDASAAAAGAGSGGGGSGGVLLQASSPGIQQTGNFNISGVGTAGAITVAGGDVSLSVGRSVRFGSLSVLSASGTSTVISNTASSGQVVALADSFAVQDVNGTHDHLRINNNGAATFSNISDSTAGFQVQNAAGQNLITVDTLGGNVALQARGTGDVSLTTATSTGVSGDISIVTGTSSTTASGNITIDTGDGIIDGTVVGTKTFEGGLDNMVNWFGSTVAQSSAQAHGGTSSLSMTAAAEFWGVQENINNPITPVVPGHQYHFSMWVRAETTSRLITSKAVWVGGAGGSLNLQTVADNNTGWTEITGNGIAPAGATGVYNTMQSTAAIGEVHYFDDIVVTDLSSSSAASNITIGDTNAKMITIGNLNQIGATSIFGGSGINLASGVSGISMNGGSISINGNSNSSLSTSAGALTLTSAAAATWSISNATAGIGGTLTIHAGGGGSDGNNDGGDILLQGGTRNGTGTAGSVIVKPPTDITDAFQIQNSSGTPLLVANSTGMSITVLGTDATYATFILTDAHFRSTQTTAPTIGTPASCGTSPSAAVTAGSTDSAGSFTITTGTGGTSSTCDTVFTFRRAYATAPKSILVVGKTDAASAARQIYVSAVGTGSFTASFGTSAGGADNTTYSFSYWVIE